MIITTKPGHWKELEKLTFSLFTEIGCKCVLGKKLKTARGSVNVDIFVEDQITNPPSTYLCECKYWKRKIPKSVVDAFRTQVSDFGANRGYLISNAGFQKGAVESSEHSNIVLITWNEILDLFKDRWIDAMTARWMELIKEIPDKQEEMFKAIGNFNQMSTHLQNLVGDLLYRFASISPLILNDKLPRKIANPFMPKNSGATLKLNSIRERYMYAISLAEQIIKNYDLIISDNTDLIKWNKPIIL